MKTTRILIICTVILIELAVLLNCTIADVDGNYPDNGGSYADEVGKYDDDDDDGGNDVNSLVIDTTYLESGVSLHFSDRTYGVYAVSGYVYAANGENGLQVVDVSNPLSPVRIGNNSLSTWSRDCCNVGDYVYMADRDDGLVIYDVSNKRSPLRTAVISLYGYEEGVFVKDDYAYVPCDWSGLSIVDVSDESSPSKIIQLNPVDGCFEGVYVKGNYAYIADYSGYLQVFDVTDKSNPTVAGTYYTGGSPLDVFVKDNLVYVCCRSAGLAIYDCTVPTNLVKKYEYYNGGEAWSVVVNEDGRIFVADGEDGLEVLTISNNVLTELFSCNTAGYSYDVSVNGNIIAIADGLEGIVVLEMKETE